MALGFSVPSAAPSECSALPAAGSKGVMCSILALLCGFEVPTVRATDTKMKESLARESGSQVLKGYMI